MILPRVVNRVLGDLDGERRGFNDKLTRQARLRRESPSHVEHIFFLFLRVWQRRKSFFDHHMAGGAGTRLFAGVLDGDFVL